MTQLERLQLQIPEEKNNEVLEDKLESAKFIILARRHPFGELPDELDKRYLDLQVRIAVQLYNKAGAEGEISHSENGVSRGYSGTGISPDLLNEIVPLGDVR